MTQVVALSSAFLLGLPMASLMVALIIWLVIVRISRFLGQTRLIASLRLAHLQAFLIPTLSFVVISSYEATSKCSASPALSNISHFFAGLSTSRMLSLYLNLNLFVVTLTTGKKNAIAQAKLHCAPARVAWVASGLESEASVGSRPEINLHNQGWQR